MPVEYLTPAIQDQVVEDRAVEVLMLLAARVSTALPRCLT
jgi:hypothetical protein